MTVVIYGAVVAAAVLRVAAALAPELTLLLVPASGAGWLVAFLGFALAYGPLLASARRR
jgi:uncharacterized protein involved in response to NO